MSVDLRAAIAAYAQECRDRYRPDPQPDRTPLNRFEYDYCQRAVAEGRTPAWFKAAWERGAFVRAGEWR